MDGTKPDPVSYLSHSEEEKLAAYLLDVGYVKTRQQFKTNAEKAAIEKGVLPKYKEYLFQRRFEEEYDLYDEEYSRWQESNHPNTLPNQVSSNQN